MSASFTPGPWKLTIEPYEDDPFPGKDFFILRLADDTLTGITDPANARLMAAAPDLFDALTNLVGLARAAGVSPAYCNDADDALAKASAQTVSA